MNVDDLEGAIETYTNELPPAYRYRLDMIKPADDPTEALLSNETGTIRLIKRREDFRSKKGGMHRALPPVVKTDWHAGRSGMEYRDLLPDRMDGRVIASHIRLTKGGEVPDYVHYHKIDFQVIYCLKGRIKVVYEDQGPPFWLEAGDCVLQPPEIRHRVLQSTAGAEVIEVSSPAEHETWVEHDITLPTSELKPDREFSDQRFVRHMAANAAWQPSEFDGFEAHDTGIGAATGGLAEVRVLRPLSDKELTAKDAESPKVKVYIPLDDGEILAVSLEI
jgi:quercetin dioxygenase-like cupin family protein